MTAHMNVPKYMHKCLLCHMAFFVSYDNECRRRHRLGCEMRWSSIFVAGSVFYGPQSSMLSASEKGKAEFKI